MTEKYLGKFPIIKSSGHEIERRLQLSDESGRHEASLSLAYYPDELHISAAISQETIDEHLVPRLLLMRDIYNSTMAQLEADDLSKLTATPKVLPPRFLLTLLHQASLKEARGGINPEEFKGSYNQIIQRLCNRYKIKNTFTEADWLHEERAVLPVIDGYAIEILKPTTHIQNFEVSANNKAGYDKLAGISEGLMRLVEEVLGDKIDIDKTPYTSCSFLINLDVSEQKLLSSAKGIEKLLLKQ